MFTFFPKIWQNFELQKENLSIREIHEFEKILYRMEQE